MSSARAVVSSSEPGYWRLIRALGRLAAYLGVPVSTLSAEGGLLKSPNVLIVFYAVSVLGLVATLRGAPVRSREAAFGIFLLAWYLVLLAIEALHGGPFRYLWPRGTNYLTDYFPLIGLPFFVIGLRACRVNFEVLQRFAILTLLFTAGLSLNQYFAFGIPRPQGYSLNPIPFALIVLTWDLFLLAGALQGERVQWSKMVIVAVGLIPILLSGSKIVWLCAVIGFVGLFVPWAVNRGRWRTLGGAALGAIVAGVLLSQLDLVRSRVDALVADLSAFASSGDTSGGTFGIRYDAAVSGLLAFLDRPWFGYGLSLVKSAALEYRPANFAGFEILPHLHNDYVTHLVAFGIVGGAFIVSLLAVSIAAASRRGEAWIARFGVVIGVVFAIYMAADVVFTQPEVYGVFFFALGIVFASPPRDQDPEKGAVARTVS